MILFLGVLFCVLLLTINLLKPGTFNGIYDSVDLLSSQKKRHNILCEMLEWAALYCVLIFKIGVNQQSHI